MLSVIHSGALLGVESVSVTVEINTTGGEEKHFFLVGLPDAAVKESMDRVESALHNSGFDTPFGKTTINLAPGDLRKEGALYDLPIALGILAATGRVRPDRLGNFLIAGELSLSGATRAVRGGVALALQARREHRAGVLLPRESAEEAALVEGVDVYAIASLHEAVDLLNNLREFKPVLPTDSPFRRPPPPEAALDFAEVKGQKALRRAVEVAVAGGHNLLMIGPPGSGKSMVARRIPTILPDPTLDEFLEILGIQSAAGVSLAPDNRCFQRPFRSPHHTISDVGLIGGGSTPGPGEISLAHHGVLFLDELPEFKRSALEVLRQPLEDGNVTISRAAGKITLPSQFMLVAAMNPTPCGHAGPRCRCTPTQIQRYRARISGPLLDRIDIHIEAPELSIEELRTAALGESSAAVRTRIMGAREIQSRRFASAGHAPTQACNARMTPKLIRIHCALDAARGQMLQRAMEKLNLSARAYDRILKVARTIADLDASEHIGSNHLAEAIQYRSLDRNLLGKEEPTRYTHNRPNPHTIPINPVNPANNHPADAVNPASPAAAQTSPPPPPPTTANRQRRTQMKISLKLEYACRVLACMGRLYGTGRLAHIEDLAKAEAVPQNYLVQILNALRNGDLLLSRRGKQGGYSLARPPAEISLHEIITVIDPDLLEMRANPKGQSGPAVTEVWSGLSNRLNKVLQKTTLASMIPRYTTETYDI